MFTCSSRGTGVLACSLCPRARRTPKGAGGSPQLRPTGSGRSCTRSRLLLSFFLFSLFWRLRRWRPGCTRAHAVIPTRGIISKMQRVADDEVFSTHPRDPVAAKSRACGRGACPEQPRGRRSDTAGTGTLGTPRGHPTPSYGRKRRPQEGCLRPCGSRPPRLLETARPKRARSPSASNTPHGSTKSFQGKGERLGASPVWGGRCSGR